MEAQDIAKQYSAMLESVALVNEVLGCGDTDDESKDCVSRNIEHLENMITKDYWTNEDMSTVNQAIDDGNTYLGGK
jgi:transcription termination factor NusB